MDDILSGIIQCSECLGLTKGLHLENQELRNKEERKGVDGESKVQESDVVVKKATIKSESDGDSKA